MDLKCFSIYQSIPGNDEKVFFCLLINGFHPRSLTSSCKAELIKSKQSNVCHSQHLRLTCSEYQEYQKGCVGLDLILKGNDKLSTIHKGFTPYMECVPFWRWVSVGRVFSHHIFWTFVHIWEVSHVHGGLN